MPNHPMVETLVVLARADLAIVHAEKKLKALSVKSEVLSKTGVEKEKNVTSAEKNISDLKRQEIQLQREIESYQKRRSTAVKALETGVGNPDSAERQVKQCAQIIDDLEFKLLENMDEQESATEALESARLSVSHHSDVRATFSQNSKADASALHTVIADNSSARAGVFKSLDVTIQKRYEQLRRAKGTAVARVIEQCCRPCRLALPMQDFSDLSRGREVHCLKCGRWLFIAPG